MCDMCNGKSAEEVHLGTTTAIERYGWSVTLVEPSAENIPWAYSIGLVEGFGHPELAVVGLDPLPAGRLINSLGERVRAGEVLAPGRTADPPDGLTFGSIDPEQWVRGTFASWTEYYGERGAPFPDPRAVQVFVSGWPASRAVLLADPEVDLYDLRPDPATRRHHRRGRSAPRRR